ncbi:hypothetical protein E2C01_054994 [Portunus trituberculatus]|uniref:Uncharacterized protein n=1 Tax=Portunus trituberculatus TaxID=210409 RepID=A0A5B7GWG1_PORTR|nr:hypothetical protein [Portunus trituberculatus]
MGGVRRSVLCLPSPLKSVGCGTRLGRTAVLGCERGGGNLYCRRSEGNAAPNIPLASSAAATAAAPAPLVAAAFMGFVHEFLGQGCRGTVWAAEACEDGDRWRAGL